MRRMMTLGTIVLLTGCEQPDVESADNAPPEDGAACLSEALRSTTPFAHVIDGTAMATRRNKEEVKIGVKMELYFPDGRKAGAPVLAVLRYDYPSKGMSIAQGTVTPELGFGPLEVGASVFYKELVLQQRNASSPITFTVKANVADYGSDIYDEANGEGRFCSTTLSIAPGQLTLRETIHPLTRFISWAAPLPLDVRSFPSDAALLVNGQPHPGTFEVYTSGFSFKTTAAIPPNAEVRLNVDGLKDALGRPISYAPPQSSLTTTQSIADLSFESEPLEGSLAGSLDDIRVHEGTLQIGIAERQGHHPFKALVSLGDPGDVSKAHLKARMECRKSYQSLRAALVAEDGTSSPVEVPCGDELAEVSVTVPAVGPLWLLVVDDSPGSQPQSAPVGRGDQLIIDEISFE